VQGVMQSGSVVVRYQGLNKKWTINPELLDKKVNTSQAAAALCTV